MGAAYAVRIMIVRRVGFDAAGLYQSAWTLGGLYVGFILQAMGADFYPRLTAVIRDRTECNRLVNEQTEVSLLLAGPGMIATLTFAPLVVSLLYSSAFGAAVDVLRWICLGATLQVITWPMGFIIVAEGRQGIFFWSEVAYTVIHLGVAWVLVRIPGRERRRRGLLRAPTCSTASSCTRSCGGSPASVGRGPTAGSASSSWRSSAWCSAPLYVLPFWLATAVGGLSALSSAAYSLRALVRLVSPRRVPPALYRVLVWARLVSRGEP